MIESEWVVYRWDDESMEFERCLFIKHGVGEQVTAAMVKAAMEYEIKDFRAGLYRAVPRECWIDIRVDSQVVLL